MDFRALRLRTTQITLSTLRTTSGTTAWITAGTTTEPPGRRSPPQAPPARNHVLVGRFVK